MATATLVRDFKTAQNGVSVLAQAELATFWASLDTSNAAATSAALKIFMPELLHHYGDMGAAVAADFYNTLRADSKARKVYRAVLSTELPVEQIQVSTNAVLKPLWGIADPKQALSNLNGVTDRLVKAPARDTIAFNVSRDPAKPKFSRVTSGSSCPFCVMLAGRGAVYGNEKSAGAAYHDHCNCVAVPEW